MKLVVDRLTHVLIIDRLPTKWSLPPPSSPLMSGAKSSPQVLTPRLNMQGLPLEEKPTVLEPRLKARHIETRVKPRPNAMQLHQQPAIVAPKPRALKTEAAANRPRREEETMPEPRTKAQHLETSSHIHNNQSAFRIVKRSYEPAKDPEMPQSDLHLSNAVSAAAIFEMAKNQAVIGRKW